ncbi:MAG TPA: CPBP family intramembrane glutamic endopeptidase [Gemmatimonadales bacterium]
MCISSEQSKSLPEPEFFHLALAGEAGLLLLAWGLARWLEVSPAAYLRLTPGAVLWGVLATAPLLLGLVWMLKSTAAPVRGLVDLVTQQIGPLVSRCTLLQLGCLAAVAGISEEVLFRGVVQPGLTAWLPQVGALVMASVIFGLVHAASRVYALFASAMGLYLGALFLFQGSLIPPILAHGLYDLVALVAVAARYRNTQR